jgi:hypothetical protein
MYALIRKTDNKKILLWWSQSPCVIRTLREIDGFRDPEIIAIPPKNMIEFYSLHTLPPPPRVICYDGESFSTTETTRETWGEVFLFRRIAILTESINRACVQAVDEFALLPFAGLLDNLLADDVMMSHCATSAKCDSVELKKLLSFHKGNEKMKQAWATGIYLKYSQKIKTLTNAQQVNDLKLEFQREFSESFRV